MSLVFMPYINEDVNSFERLCSFAVHELVLKAKAKQRIAPTNLSFGACTLNLCVLVRFNVNSLVTVTVFMFWVGLVLNKIFGGTCFA